MKVSPVLALLAAILSLSLPACHRMNAEEKDAHEDQHKIVVTSPLVKDVTITQQYVCQIRSQQHIEVCALQDGYLDAILVKEGQAVKKGDVMFKVLPTLYKARLDAEKADADLALIKFNNTKRLYENKGADGTTLRVVSDQEVALAQAELDKANAKRDLAAAELNFTEVRAKFDGIVDRLHKQLGSLIEKKDVLTTLSDNSLMWVYFNVPEARYFEYKALQGKGQEHSQHLKLADARIELLLADGNKFDHDAGNTVTVEGKFNNETGNIAFRADFPNPNGLLRHGQTGTVLIHRRVNNALVIPQRATFEILEKRYVYVIGEDHIVHPREIDIQHEMDDIFVIKNGLNANDKIVLEGVRQIRDGEKLEYELRTPTEALATQKHHAE